MTDSFNQKSVPTGPLTDWLLSVQGREQGTRVVTPGETVPFDANGNVFFRTPPYKDLQVEADAQLDTARYFSRRGRVPCGSEAILTLHHGTGAPYSHSGALFSALNSLTAGPTQRCSGFVAALQSDPNHLFLAAEAVDSPGHGAGPDLSGFESLERTLAWMQAHYLGLKSFGLPVVPLTRSGAAGPVVALNQNHSGLFSALILMSPLHPLGLEHSMGFLQAAAAKPPTDPEHVVIRWPCINWINGLYAQISKEERWRPTNPFGSTPTLVLMGRRDPQISTEARAAFIRYALNSGDLRDPFALAAEATEDIAICTGSVWYVQLAQADHDVLQNRDRLSAQTALKAYSYIYRFLRHALVPPGTATQRRTP